MAHKKAGGSTRNGRDSAGRRLGVKKFGGEVVSSRKYYNQATRDKIPSWKKCFYWKRPHHICY